jgi:hypothetical protein
MNKIKQMMLESKAIKHLGEDNYNSIKKDFTDTFRKLCTDIPNRDNIDCRLMINYLKYIKNQIWLNTLFECLGGAMCGAALYRMDTYSLKETMISCAVGLGVTAIGGIRNYLAKKKFDEVQDDFVEYVYSNMSMYCDDNAEYMLENRDNSNYFLTTCKSACNELLD